MRAWKRLLTALVLLSGGGAFAQAPTSTALTSSVNPSYASQTTQLRAVVTGASPTGQVTFKYGATTLATKTLSSGAATYDRAFTTTGALNLTAVYLGDAGNATSTSPVLVQTVNAKAVTTTSLVSSVNPAALSQSVTLTATVSGGSSPGDTITFKDGSATLGTATLASGQASRVAIFTTSGAHNLTAVYGGNTSHAGSTSSVLVQTIGGAADPNQMVWRFGYDPQGNPTTTTDPNGNVTTQSYDRLQRNIEVLQPAPAASAPRPAIAIGYDGQDRVSSVRDPRSLTTAYTVDGVGNVKSQASPDSGTSNATFDAAGNVLTSTDARGKTTTYTWDVLNRVKTLTYPTGVGTTFEYDGGAAPYPGSVGQLTKVTDESGVTNFAYDSLGRLTSRSALVAGKTITTAYSWGTAGTATGKITSVTYPSKARVNYAYDTAGRVKTLTVNPPTTNGAGTNTGAAYNLVVNITYTADNQPKGWTWGNNAPYTRSFDSFGRLASYPVGYPQGTGNALGLTRTLGYDNAARIRSYSHPNASFDQTFAYDGLDRLTQQMTSATTYGYVYDATGNRTSRTIGGTTYTDTVAASSNRLTNVQTPGTGGTTVNNAQSYTASGSLTADGTATYTYSDRGRMGSSTVSGQVTSYKYNGLEQRVSKTGPLVPTGAAYYAYDEDGQTLGEYDTNLYSVAETVYVGSTPVAVLKLTGTVAGNNIQLVIGNVYADQVDTPRVITRNSDEAIIWRWDATEAFGNTAPNENPSGFGPYRFNQRMPGQIFDLETNSFYNWNRDYQPKSGRYAQSDPIGLFGGINTYAYVENNPLSRTDPSGLGPLGNSIGGTFGGVIGRIGGGALGGISPIPGGAILGSIGGSAAGTRIGAAVGSALEDLCRPESPCEQKRKEIEDWIIAMEKKYLEMQVDRNGLFGVPSTGTWEGHIYRYENMKNRLRKLIDEAAKLGCIVPPRAYELLARPAPKRPTP